MFSCSIADHENLQSILLLCPTLKCPVIARSRYENLEFFAFDWQTVQHTTIINEASLTTCLSSLSALPVLLLARVPSSVPCFAPFLSRLLLLIVFESAERAHQAQVIGARTAATARSLYFCMLRGTDQLRNGRRIISLHTFLTSGVSALK
jgi:hypothetical protein